MKYHHFIEDNSMPFAIFSLENLNFYEKTKEFY
jgi:hypothetical protein